MASDLPEENDLAAEMGPRWEEEALFARDIDGQLVRAVKATRDDYDLDIKLTIDDQEVTVKKAVPERDSQGNLREDEHGRSVPRLTTIYDAAQKVFERELGDVNPIPTLCHQEHLRPVAVCRVCTVEVCRKGRDGKATIGGKLVPACQHPVSKDMIVHTMYSPNEELGQRVRTSVKVLTELLAADHLRPRTGASDRSQPNDLERHVLRLERELGIQCNPQRLRISAPSQKPQDNSSKMIAVDHSLCILCERCKRGCTDVKENFVIGRTGKGYTAHIAFDLNEQMEDSTCVSCGECTIYCPTDALQFLDPVKSQWHKNLVSPPAEGTKSAGAAPGSSKSANSAVTAEELQEIPIFKSLPYKWLQWNASSIVRRRLQPGDLLCRQGEYGNTAFILLSGKFGIWFKDPAAVNRVERPERGLSGIFAGLFGKKSPPPGDQRPPAAPPDVVVGTEDLILGEMTCMSFYRRNATVAAVEDGEILEIRRNVLYALQRNKLARDIFDRVYRERALNDHLRTISLFKELTSEERKKCEQSLREKVELVRVDPGQLIFAQKEKVDHFYMIRVGYVKVSQKNESGTERVLAYLGPGKYFGEIGMIARTADEAKLELEKGLSGRRTATCTALDDVELVRIRGKDFGELLLQSDKLREKFVELSRQRLAQQHQQPATTAKPARETADETQRKFLDQGLFNAQKLLVLDLESCTRCDECVRACADTHGGVTRLVREGVRFDKFLVASACRSCEDPYCLVGCPVDSIHRDHSLEIVIEDHCIGCGQCAKNCPYGNINMAGFEQNPDRPSSVKAEIKQQATTCDLCSSVADVHPGDEVSCVYACPHNAAFRMSGRELFEAVQGSASR